MSELRDQLQSIKADYDSARYPGDLAADVMPELQLRAAAGRRNNPWRILAGASLLAGAVAAAVVVWVAHPAGQVAPPARMPASSPPVVAQVPHEQPQPAQQLQQSEQDQPAAADEVAQADEDTDLFGSISNLAPPALPADMPMAPSADMFELGSMPSIPTFTPTFPDTSAVSPTTQEST
jgi:hypothetical protein